MKDDLLKSELRKLVHCSQFREDCFANVGDNRCYALSDTNFLYKECTFYKKKEEVKKDESKEL